MKRGRKPGRAVCHSERKHYALKMCRPCYEKETRTPRQIQANGLRRYKMTVKEYETLLARQGGVCALCKRPPKIKRLGVDHDHHKKVDAVRGLLCGRCNRALAVLGDTLEGIQRVVHYLLGEENHG